ncbi:MAG: branched-chain amino acid ABC transporter permease [Halobacteriales archaeon]
MAVSTGLPNAVVTGIVTGSIVAMGGIGLALVYSIAEVPNFAHGELLTLGAFMALFVNTPNKVPVFELLATGPQSISTAGLLVLFLLAAGATLGIVYLLDGSSGLRGSWWPVDPPPILALVAHVALAVLLGAGVALGAPSIWAGVLLAALLVGVIAPLTEKIVFRTFREEGASLATMLIAALGVSLILRFGTQAIYGGASRLYSVPGEAKVLGTTQYLTNAKFFDLYLRGTGAIVHLVETGTDPDTTISTIGFGWLAVLVILGGTVAVAYGSYRWRRQAAGGFVEAQTVGPKLTGTIAGLAALIVLSVGLASGTTVPEQFAYATRIRLFPLKLLIVLIAVLMMVSLHLLLQETKLGTAMRASSDNLDLAKVTGINTDRVMMATWIIAGLYAGLAGVMLGLSLSRVQVNIGFFLLLPMFAAVILGGIRSVYGVILGSYVVGLAMDVGFTVLPVGNNYRVPIAFGVLFAVLLVRPEGLVGRS